MCIINNIYVKYLQQPQSAEEPANNLTDLQTQQMSSFPQRHDIIEARKTMKTIQLSVKTISLSDTTKSENGNTFASIGKPKI